MKGFFSLISAALFATAAVAAVPSIARDDLHLNPVGIDLKTLTNVQTRDNLHMNPQDIELKELAHGEISPRYMTNAQRMARGLNPKAPVLRELRAYSFLSGYLIFYSRLAMLHTATAAVSASMPKRSASPSLAS
jgi:hypothetical protein